MPDQPLKKADSTKKIQIQDKYTKIPFKIPKRALNGSVYILNKLNSIKNFSELFVLLKSNLKLQN